MSTLHVEPKWAADPMCFYAYVVDIPQKKFHVLTSIDDMTAKPGDILYDLGQILEEDVLGTVRVFDIDEHLMENLEEE